jgi:short-subunit dehydrogenase
MATFSIYRAGLPGMCENRGKILNNSSEFSSMAGLLSAVVEADRSIVGTR